MERWLRCLKRRCRLVRTQVEKNESRCQVQRNMSNNAEAAVEKAQKSTSQNAYWKRNALLRMSGLAGSSKR